MFKVFIGADSRDPELAEVCKFSILKYSTVEIDFEILHLDKLKEQQLITRPTRSQRDIHGEADHLYTRFLVPYLSSYKGWALYVDSDFLFLDDIAKLFKLCNDRYAVMCVQESYTPNSSVKFNNRPQFVYPRKNWASLMLYNCEHTDLLKLTPTFVNEEPKLNLLCLEWLPNRSIGQLPKNWNWLPGYYATSKESSPQAVHFTEGGPWIPEGKAVEYGAYWVDAYNELFYGDFTDRSNLTLDSVPIEIQDLLNKILLYRVDPAGMYYSVTKRELHKMISKLDNNAVYAVEAETMEETNSKHEHKGHAYDPFLQSFIMGSGGQIAVWDRVKDSQVPVVLRGVTKRKQMLACRETGRDFYYIDTGYFGNSRKKTFHRITKNDMQNLGPVIHRPRDRLAFTGYQARKFRPGSKILLAPPSQKLLMCYNLDLSQWIKDTVEEIKKHTDREIVIREKQGRSVRVTTDTIEMALDQDIHCLVTFSSIAAVEAVLFGKPAIVLGPSAAHSVCSQSLGDLEKPYIPTLDEVEEWAAHLAYCQFTELEMRNGTAWNILNEHA